MSNSENAKRLDNIFQGITNNMKNDRRPNDSTFKYLNFSEETTEMLFKRRYSVASSFEKEKKINKETLPQVLFLRILRNFSKHFFNRTLLDDCFKLLL